MSDSSSRSLASGRLRGVVFSRRSRPKKRGVAPQSRQRRRPLARSRWRVAFFGLAIVGLVGGVTWALIGSKLLVVRSVVVTGTNLVAPSTVLTVAGVQLGTPMVRVNTAQVAARVDGIRDVASVEVDKSWPDRIVIRVTERVSVLAVGNPDGGFDLVDRSGVVVRWVAARPARFPLLRTTAVASSLRGSPAVSLASAVLSELPPDLRSAVRSVAVADDQVTATLASGVSVMWGGTDRPDVKAQVLSILMRTHARFYDVSAPGFAMTSG